MKDKHTVKKLHEFHSLLNGLNNNIQFTIEYSGEKLPFLDILIKKVNNRIETDVYYKNTDSKQYLLFSSCHPKHTKTNIPFNLSKRICTIVSDKNTRDLRLHELKQFLINRQYPPSLIDDGIKRAKTINTQTLRQIKPNNTPDLTYVC